MQQVVSLQPNKFQFREKRFAPPPLLKRLVLAGHHGKKTGRGFYDWSDPANPKPLF